MVADVLVPDRRVLVPERQAHVEGPVGPGIAGIVDEYRRRTEFGGDLFEDCGDGGAVGHVEHGGHGLDAHRANFRDHFVGAARIEIVDRDAARVVLRQFERDAAPDALARSGDQRHLSTDVECIFANHGYAFSLLAIVLRTYVTCRSAAASHGRESIH